MFNHCTHANLGSINMKCIYDQDFHFISFRSCIVFMNIFNSDYVVNEANLGFILYFPYQSVIIKI